MDILILVIVGAVVVYTLVTKVLVKSPTTVDVINDAVSDAEEPADYSGLTKAQLLDVAKHQGASVTARNTKAQIIEALK